MKRRHFLQVAGAALPALWFGRSLAAPAPGTPRLLVVFLRGGYDCLNVLVPHASSDYYAARPGIAIPKTDDLLLLDADWALHPALATPLARCGMRSSWPSCPSQVPKTLRAATSKPRTTSNWASPVDHPDARSGFLARLDKVLAGQRAISFTDSLPVSYRGADDVPNISLKSVAKPVFDDRQAQILADM